MCVRVDEPHIGIHRDIGQLMKIDLMFDFDLVLQFMAGNLSSLPVVLLPYEELAHHVINTMMTGRWVGGWMDDV